VADLELPCQHFSRAKPRVPVGVMDIQDADKTKRQLVSELVVLRARVDALEDLVGQQLHMVAALEHLMNDQRRVVEMLQHSEIEIARAMVEAPFPIMIHAEDGEIVALNKAWTEKTAFSRSELTTTAAWIRCAYRPEEQALVSEAVRRTYAIRSQVDNGEFALHTARGEERNWSFSSAPLGQTPDGRRTVITMAMDVTERRRAEEALRRYAADLEARTEELDAFAHTVAHDLGNPLARVVGYAELLEEVFVELSTDEVVQYLRTISGAGRHAGRIVQALLLLASVRQVEEVPVARLDMRSIVENVLERLDLLMLEKQPLIVLPDAWPAVVGYEPWVEEVWENYLSNALKYGGEPCHIELGWDAQSPATAGREGAPYVHFWVRDNGPGIPADYQAQLFSPFVRLPQSTGKGHGLGLSIVKRIVEKLGGEVAVESGPGQGTRFSFTLPPVLLAEKVPDGAIR
jgi:PAS domain S-box-containing protein